MAEIDKKIILENSISSIDFYIDLLEKGNIEDFNRFVSSILQILSENERIRFSQIEFFTEQEDYQDNTNIDLPF